MMNTFQSPQTQQILLPAQPAETPGPESACRLVVVVPAVAEPALLAARVHLVAAARSADVLLIGMSSRLVPANDLQRGLMLAAEFLRDAGTKVEVRLEQDLDWIAAERRAMTDADLLACAVDENLAAAGDRWIDLLADKFQRPVYAFMAQGLQRMPASNPAGRIAPWLASVAVILGFLLLQVRLSQSGVDPLNTVWLLASVVAEIGLIGLCNALLG